MDYPLSNSVNIYVLPKRKITKVDKLKRIKDVYTAIKTINPDIIIPFIDTVVICSFIANIFISKKFIYTVRVSPWHEGQTSTSFSRLVRKVIAKKADAIMLQNNEQAEFFPKNYSVKEFVVPNPIPDKYNSIRKECYRNEIRNIVMVGRLDKQKNYPLALCAMHEFTSSSSLVKLHIYGEGIEMENLSNRIKELGLERVCILEGRTQSIDEVLKDADLYLMTSNYEGMPNALMEAMAMGVPCISTNCKTGPKDLISNGNNGLLIKTNDVNELVNALIWASENPQAVNDMGRKGREHIIKNYQLDNITNLFVKMIETM